MQQVTARAMSATAGIMARIREIDALTGSISTAVEQQGAATQEIVRNVPWAVQGSGEVISAVTAVAAASGAVARHAERLSDETTRFLDGLRAA